MRGISKELKAPGLLSLICASVVFGITTVFLASFVPGVWICDLLNQFQVFYASALLLCLLALLLLRARVLSVVCLVFFLAALLPLVTMFSHRNCRVSEKDKSLTVLNFNTEFQHNNNYELFKNVVHERNPDVIALVEVDQKWIDALSDTCKPYPYRKIVLDGAGLAVFSRYPLENIDVRHFGKTHHPRISAVLKFDERSVNLLVVHPPTPQSEPRFHERNQELSIFADEIASTEGATLLIGDLNCGPWSFAFKSLLSKTGLLDSEQGFGPQLSWPGRVDRVFQYFPLPPLIPIDHVLVSKEICVRDRKVGPAVGSDHMPVYVRLSVAAAGAVPAPK